MAKYYDTMMSEEPTEYACSDYLQREIDSKKIVSLKIRGHKNMAT